MSASVCETLTETYRPPNMDEVVRLASGTDIEFIYGRSAGKYLGELDCRLLFLGENHRQLLAAYEQVGNCFSESTGSDDLVRRLNASEFIKPFYEVADSGGIISVHLHDSIFYEQGAVDDLEIELQISNGELKFSTPLPVCGLKPLGLLLPLLCGKHSLTEIVNVLKLELPNPAAAWAIDLVTKLSERQLVQSEPATGQYFSSSGHPTVTFLGHTSLLVQSLQTAVLVDPLLLGKFGQPRSVFDVTRLKLGAICLTHSHWDHCNLQTLILFDKSTPVIIPTDDSPSE